MKKSLLAAGAFVVLVCSVLVAINASGNVIFGENRSLTLIRENLVYGDPLYNLFYFGGIIFFCYFSTSIIKRSLRKN